MKRRLLQLVFLIGITLTATVGTLWCRAVLLGGAWPRDSLRIVRSWNNQDAAVEEFLG